MGKKYIIEIPEDKIADFVGSTHFLMPYMMAGHIWHHDTGLPIEPYTELDLVQLRKEAYAEGYKEGMQLSIDDAKLKEEYQQGINDAWEAVGKIYNMCSDVRHKIFKENLIQKILSIYSASEAIEKTRQYEQEQEYHVGDEFENGAGQKFVVLKMDGKEIDRYIDGDGKTYVMDAKYRVMRKTGRHFPEIGAVLEKMRGEKE